LNFFFKPVVSGAIDRMDDKRTLLAILLSVGVFILFTLVTRQMTPPGPPPPAAAPGAGAAPRPPAPTGGGEARPGAGAAPAPAAVAATPAQPEEVVALETPIFRLELTNRGAALRRLILKPFRAALGSEAPLVLLDEFEDRLLTFQIRDLDAAPGMPDLSQVTWEIVRPESTAARAVFQFVRPDGLAVRKTIEVDGDTYRFRGALTFENRRADQLLKLRPSIVGAAGISNEGGEQYLTGATGFAAQGRWSVRFGPNAAAALDKEEEIRASDGASRLQWAGAIDKYFAAILAQDPASWGDLVSFVIYRGIVDSARFRAERERRSAGRGPLTPEELQALRKESVHSVAPVFHLREFPLEAGAKRTLAWHFFAGPRQAKVLDANADLGLDALYEFNGLGFFFYKPFSRLLLWLLKILHAVVGNFGVAVILLTVVVRLCLFPISRKAQVSMFRLQKLAPQVKALQERFKEDRHRLTAETMKLYKQNKVSPMGGCLPLLLQMPIFIGLYNALLYAIELRQAPFVAWIRDLSEPDHLARLPFSVLGQTSLNLLPILMVIPMTVQSAIAPKPADPTMAQQQKMMTWMMPVMFLFMCYTMPSGVSLYWFFSSLWGIAESKAIKAFWLKDGPSPAAPAAGR
jgi:YidC/Oxa1 family membrane protein insertase